MLKLLFGEMSTILTGSIRMNPKKLLDSGFKFNDTDLKTYFENQLGL